MSEKKAVGWTRENIESYLVSVGYDAEGVAKLMELHFGNGGREDDRQKLVDIVFEIGLASAEYMHGKKPEEVAAWIADQLAKCGYKTKPMGASWGVLTEDRE